MPNNRDFLDDIIEMQRDFRAVTNPLGNLANALMSEPKPQKPWDPSAYKFRPHGNPASCLRCILKDDEESCSACLDVCPVDALTIEKGSIAVSDKCRKCGLCVSVCPVDSMSDGHNTPRKIYERIMKAAASYEVCYVTCTRALGRHPEPNEVVLPCVGTVSTATWFAILADYPNVCVYLPMGICDRCRNVTGEEVYVEQIGRAEEITTRSVGLECEESDLNREKRRSYERREFMDSLVRTGQTALMVTNPALASARAVASRLEERTRQINQLSRTLEEACGSTNAQKKRRILTQKRTVELSTLQAHPRLAERLGVTVPVCDFSRCTMCAECTKACPTHTIELDEAGRISVEEAYCLSCEVCVKVCPEAALEMRPVDPELLIIPDPEAERIAKEVERQKAEAARLKEEGRKKLKKLGDVMEDFDQEEEE